MNRECSSRSFTAINPRWAVYSRFGPLGALVLLHFRSPFFWLRLLFGVRILVEGTIAWFGARAEREANEAPPTG